MWTVRMIFQTSLSQWQIGKLASFLFSMMLSVIASVSSWCLVFVLLAAPQLSIHCCQSQWDEQLLPIIRQSYLVEGLLSPSRKMFDFCRSFICHCQRRKNRRYPSVISLAHWSVCLISSWECNQDEQRTVREREREKITFVRIHRLSFALTNEKKSRLKTLCARNTRLSCYTSIGI